MKTVTCWRWFGERESAADEVSKWEGTYKPFVEEQGKSKKKKLEEEDNSSVVLQMTVTLLIHHR